MSDLIEISVVVDTEAAEAVSELFNRYNGGGYEEDNEAGEAGGGGAVIEGTGFDDVEDSVRHTVSIIRRHPLMPDNVAVHGLVIHPATGKLTLVVDGKTGSTA